MTMRWICCGGRAASPYISDNKTLVRGGYAASMGDAMRDAATTVERRAHDSRVKRCRCLSKDFISWAMNSQTPAQPDSMEEMAWLQALKAFHVPRGVRDTSLAGRRDL